MEISYSVPGRNSPQCRERWVNVLDPNLKKNPDFNEAEDMELMEVCQKYHVEGNDRRACCRRYYYNSGECGIFILSPP